MSPDDSDAISCVKCKQECCWLLSDTRRMLLVSAVAVVVFSVACGFSPARPTVTNSATKPAVSITISPTTATLPAGESQSFSITITGTSYQQCAWSIAEGNSGGLISAMGVYTAPSTAGTYHITATSQADPSKSATAIVTVNAKPVVTISVSPATATLLAGGSQPFLVTISGSSNQQFIWSIAEGNSGGHINPMGVYTAPSAPGTYHVTATSQADPSKSATAIVTANDYTGTFVPVPNASSVAAWSTANLLHDGTVLTVGVVSQFFNPATLVFNPGPSPTIVPSGATATLLMDGRVLFCGGLRGAGEGFSSCEIYDPAASVFSATASMASGRLDYSATLSSDGNVLIAGGTVKACPYTCNHPLVSSADSQIYDPTNATFGPIFFMATDRFGHTATLLPNGKVLIAGGIQVCWGSACPDLPETWRSLASTELFDPASLSFAAIAPMTVSRSHHQAVVLLDGGVLIIGGLSGQMPGQALASIERFDPATQSCAQVGSMLTPRSGAAATLLGNGKILIVGGLVTIAGTTLPSATAELYDPDTNTSIRLPDMSKPRAPVTATRLLDGRVLIGPGSPEIFQ